MDNNTRALRESREHIAIERDCLRQSLNLIRAERDRYRGALDALERKSEALVQHCLAEDSYANSDKFEAAVNEASFAAFAARQALKGEA